jgi:transcriptional regulator with XRE-family HTH domain
LAKNLKVLRNKDLLTAAELARIISTSPTQIAQLESNQVKNPGFFLIDSLASFLGVSTEDLVWKDLSGVDLQVQQMNRLNLIMNQLNPESRNMIEIQMDSILKILVKNDFFSSIDRRIP